MRSAPPVSRAAAVRAAASRALVVALLVLTAILGGSLAPYPAAAAGSVEPPPPVSGTHEPAGEEQRDTAESGQDDPGRTARPVRARVEPSAPPVPHGAAPAPYAGRHPPAGPSGASVRARCVVLRC
jgi:hypothetical protein